MTEKT